MQQPLVSIVMPAYNAEKYIAESVNSILSQTYKNFELLIADDCSTRPDKRTAFHF
jgi:teichuronic acid biosynthesis glycosyltransferase TuaG